MVPSVTTVLQRFKTEWAAQLQPEAISAACEAVGYTAWRDRLLNPVITVQLFLLQILHGNTACRHLPHLAGFYFSASAYCQARAKLPIRVLEHLLERLGQATQTTTLNLSQFVARIIWRRRGVSPLCGRAHRLQRREPLRCLLVPMDTTFDLLQTAIN